MQEANSFSIKCKQCGKFFEAKGANAAYCPECRVERKKKLDHQAWLRRKYKTECIQSAKEEKCLCVDWKKHMPRNLVLTKCIITSGKIATRFSISSGCILIFRPNWFRVLLQTLLLRIQLPPHVLPL